MTDIKFSIAKVKGYIKKYKTKNGTIKETHTKTINLGANAPFTDGDSVIVINKLDYDEIKDSMGKTDEIESLQQELNTYSKKFQELSTNYQELETDHKKQFQEFQELKETNKTLQNDLIQSYERNETIHNALHKAQEDLRTKDKIITAYESYGLWDRIRKRNPKDNMELLEIEKKN